MSNEIRELSDADLNEVSGGLRYQPGLPGHPSTGPTLPPDPGHGPVIFDGAGPIVLNY
jgi:hypothetical protein